MECFGTTDFDNNSRLITLSAIIISGLHCIYFWIMEMKVMDKSDFFPLICLQQTYHADTKTLVLFSVYHVQGSMPAFSQDHLTSFYFQALILCPYWNTSKKKRSLSIMLIIWDINFKEVNMASSWWRITSSWFLRHS